MSVGGQDGSSVGQPSSSAREQAIGSESRHRVTRALFPAEVSHVLVTYYMLHHLLALQPSGGSTDEEVRSSIIADPIITLSPFVRA